MRLVTLLALTVALATTAGCFGGDDESEADGTPAPSPTPTPTATPTSPTGTNSTGDAGDTNSTGDATTPPPQPKEIENSQFDFSSNSPVSPAAPKAVTVPPGFTKGNLTVTFTPSAPVSPQSGVAVTFTDSAGNAFTCAAKANPMTAAETCEALGAIAPGEGQLSYAGEGLVTAKIVITVS